MVSARSLNHIRLFYASYFGGMGLLLPFFPVYLAARGFEAGVIGLFTGLLALAKVVSPPLTGHVLDGRPWRSIFISLATLAALVIMAILPSVDEPWLLAVLIFSFGLFWASVLPLTDGLSIAVSEVTSVDYGRLRVWGSIGFVICSLIGGFLLTDAAITRFPYWLAGLLLFTAYSAYGFPVEERDTGIEKHSASRSFSPAFPALMAAGFLMQVSHGAYYGFFSLYLLNLGYPGWQIGAFWTLAVIAEIILMWGWSRPLQQGAPAWVLGICFILAALRWLGIGLVDVWWALAGLQLLHAASFAAFHVNAVTWVRRLSPPHRQASAQGWYSACGFGLGLTVGVTSCGAIVEASGFSLAFFVCAAIALAGAVLAFLFLPGSISESGV